VDDALNHIANPDLFCRRQASRAGTPTSVDRLNSRQVHHPVSPPAASSSTHMMTFASPLQGQALSVFQYLFRLRAHLSNELPVSIALLCSPPRFRAKGYYSRHKQRALFYSSPFKTGITCMQHLAVSRSHFTLRRSHSSLHQPLPFYLQTLQHSAPAACSPWQLLQLAVNPPPPPRKCIIVARAATPLPAAYRPSSNHRYDGQIIRNPDITCCSLRWPSNICPPLLC
jgi:hypothetical protein